MPRYDSREEILAGWLAGMTGQELAAKYGCSKTAGSSLAWRRGLQRSAKVKQQERKRNSQRVRAYLVEHPRPRAEPPPKKRTLNAKAILRDYVGGMPLAKIVEKHGCDRSYPATMAKRAGIKRRRVRNG